MKRIKLVLLSTAVLFAFGTAIATRPHAYDCTFAPQYYFNGASYIPAGTYSYDYTCLSGAGVCTYYKPDPVFNPNFYLPCRYGRFQLLD